MSLERWHPEIRRKYHCSVGHWFISSQSDSDDLDGMGCTAMYSTGVCWGMLDGPYIELFDVMKAEGYE